MDPPPPPLLVPPPSIPLTFTAVAAPAPTAEIPNQAPPPQPQPQSSASPPQNHVAHGANPNPAPPTQSNNHPPYAEMIYTAITALKEREGSSKRAIAKYIERVYSGLPQTHPALLTHHLKRLKNSGLLVMVKKSYMLPRSDTTDTNTATTNTLPTAAYPHQQQPLPSHVVVTGSSPSPSSGLKRGRGRPPKPKPNGLSGQPNGLPPQVNGLPFVQPINTAAPAPSPAVASQTNSVPVGFAPDPASLGLRKRPGRPRKVLVPGQGVPVAPVAATPKQGRGRGRPPKSGPLGPKKSAGRPRKPKSVGAFKKRPGRPPKNQQLPNPVTVPYAAIPAAGAAVPVFSVPRPRGRPRKNSASPVTGMQPVAGVAAGDVVPARRPGRPPKLGVTTTPKKSSGRPVGRPKKNASASWATAEASQQQAKAYGDLKRKLELFQTRVKEAVGVLKPHLAGAAISAVVAIQELEGIASMDINAPFWSASEAQPQSQPEPPPQSQPQPQPQLQPQPPPLQN